MLGWRMMRVIGIGRIIDVQQMPSLHTIDDMDSDQHKTQGHNSPAPIQAQAAQGGDLVRTLLPKPCVRWRQMLRVITGFFLCADFVGIEIGDLHLATTK